MNRNIETENLILIACSRNTLENALAGNKELSHHLNVIVPENWTEFGDRALKYALTKIIEDESDFGWRAYLPISKTDNKLIGCCGYKGQPNENGMVEIGYEIQAKYRNNGLATELAKALIKNAFNYQNVKLVQAHTLGDINASTKVLLKCGFLKTSEIEDKENGTIWKWELKRNA